MSRGTVIDQRTWVQPVITFCESVTSSPGKPHRFYDTDAPTDADLVAGYGIVYTVAGGAYTGPPFWAPESEGVLVFQVTSVGKKRDQAQWLADRVRLSFLSRADAGGFQVPFIPPAGWVVTLREPDGVPPGADPEGDIKNRVFSIPERFRLHVEPT